VAYFTARDFARGESALDAGSGCHGCAGLSMSTVASALPFPNRIAALPERGDLYDSGVRRLLAALSSIALAVTGAQLAHALAYRLAEPNAHDRAHLLSETGHSYLRVTSAGLGLVAAIVLFALVFEVRAFGPATSAARPRFWAFAAIAPATFLFQEHFERLLHDGAFPWSAVVERTFLLGILLQLPFALLAYCVARLMLGAARVLAALLARPHITRRSAGSAELGPPVARPVAAFDGFGLGARGPPLLRSA
jgi:hypothetical protein